MDNTIDPKRLVSYGEPRYCHLGRLVLFEYSDGEIYDGLLVGWNHVFLFIKAKNNGHIYSIKPDKARWHPETFRQRGRREMLRGLRGLDVAER